MPLADRPHDAATCQHSRAQPRHSTTGTRSPGELGGWDLATQSHVPWPPGRASRGSTHERSRPRTQAVTRSRPARPVRCVPDPARTQQRQTLARPAVAGLAQRGGHRTTTDRAACRLQIASSPTPDKKSSSSRRSHAGPGSRGAHVQRELRGVMAPSPISGTHPGRPIVCERRRPHGLTNSDGRPPTPLPAARCQMA